MKIGRVIFIAGFKVLAALCLTIAAQQNPQVLIRTELGDIRAGIFESTAPVTASNFLRYVDENRYEGATFYRVLRLDNQPETPFKVELIEGGLRLDARSKRFSPIPHETTARTRVLHKDGTLSLARSGLGSAGSEFFICINDQPEMDFGGRRNPDGQGYAAFGRVIEGMNIVRRIQQMPTDGQVLIQKVRIKNIVRIPRLIQNLDGQFPGITLKRETADKERARAIGRKAFRRPTLREER